MIAIDDDDVREELVKILAARQEERACEEETVRCHDSTNDVLLEVLRTILERIDALEVRVNQMQE